MQSLPCSLRALSRPSIQRTLLNLHLPTLQQPHLRFASAQAIIQPVKRKQPTQSKSLSFPPFNHFVPLTKDKPSVFSLDYYRYLAKQVVKYGIFYHQTRELAKIYTNHNQRVIEGSTTPVTREEICKALPEEALIIYTKMNDAFARGEMEELRSLCTQDMLEVLVKELNDRKKHLSYSFVVDEIVQKPKLISAMSADISYDRDMKHYAQIVVRMQLKQTVKVTDGSGNALGEQSKITDEYVLLSRQFPPIASTPPGWLVYGKLKETGLNNPTK